MKCLTGSVSDEEHNALAVETAIKEFGHLDGAVLNAGMAGRIDLFEGDMGFFDEVMDVNVRAVILGVREEKGTLTMVKHVLCSKFANKRNIKRAVPSKGGAHIRRTNERAKGIFPNNK